MHNNNMNTVKILPAGLCLKIDQKSLWNRSLGLSLLWVFHENNRHYHGSRRNKEDTKTPGKDRSFVALF